MINKYYILEQLYIKTQKERTLECTDLLGNITKCTFQWNQPICKEQLKILKNKFNLRLPEDYEKFSTCAVAIWLGAAIKQQKYNSHILPSAL